MRKTQCGMPSSAAAARYRENPAQFPEITEEEFDKHE